MGLRWSFPYWYLVPISIRESTSCALNFTKDTEGGKEGQVVVVHKYHKKPEKSEGGERYGKHNPFVSYNISQLMALSCFFFMLENYNNGRKKKVILST